MRIVYPTCLLLPAIVSLSSIASATSSMYIDFQGPYIKTSPAEDSAAVVVDGQAGSLRMRFTCDWSSVGPAGMGFNFVFDGSADADYINNSWAVVPNHAATDIGTSNFQIGFFVKTTSTKSINSILDKRKDGNGYHVALYYGQPLIQMSTATMGHYNWYAPVAVNDGNWHKIEIYADRSRTNGGQIYSDGVLLQTFNPTGYSNQSLSNDESLWIGRHLYWPSSNFDGSLDELVINQW